MQAFARQWWFAYVPAICALVLALWAIAAPAPWWDELYTLSAVIHSPGSRVFELPLLPYYALIWLWAGAGNVHAVEWLRLLSGLAIVSGAVAVALAGRRLASPRVGFAAAMFFVLAPGVSRYSQEARPYALGAALVAFATWALVEAAESTGRRWWVAYGGTYAAAVLLLPAAWAVLPAHAVVLFSRAGRRTQFRPWLTTVLFLTPLLAVDVVVSQLVPWWHDWLAPPSIGDLPFGLLLVAGSEYTRMVVPAILVVLAVLSRAGRPWLLGIAVSVLGIFVVSLLLGSWWTARSFLPLSALLCIGAALTLARVGWWLTAGAIVLVLGASTPDHIAIRDADSRGADARQIVSVIRDHGESGDQVVESDVVALGYAWDLFLAGDPRDFRYVPEPSASRYWEIADMATCRNFEEWPVGGGSMLRLCR